MKTAEPIRVTFAGDTMMDWSIKTTINKKGADYPFSQVKSEVLKSDIAVANLESAVTTRTEKESKQYTFKSDPKSLAGLKNAGFDIVSLANNHSMDYKKAGLTDTLNNLKKYNLTFIGAGVNSKAAYAAHTQIVKGKRIKFLAFSRVLPTTLWIAGFNRAGLATGYDLKLMQTRIKEERKTADYLFVYIHWGKEKSKIPEAFQRDWARKMIDSGADGIIGSHPHVLQGFEYYKGKPIAYSLGNFLFPDYVRGDAAQTGLYHIDIQNNAITTSFTPYFIAKDQIIAQSLQTRKMVWSKLQAISYGVKIQNGKIVKK
ncbi:capsular biosynthesis protein [Bacillus sp. M6-12]|nr:capsular biosynthesis protein [Bacillus sp. M6-12]